MRLANRTTLDPIQLARIVNAVCPRGLDDETMVIFEPVAAACCSGLAWARDSKFPGSIPHAYIYVTVEPLFPQYPPPMKNRFTGLFGFTVRLRNIEQSLVYTVAHELAHLHFGHSERVAHAWGMRMVRRYLRRGLPAPQSVNYEILRAA